MTEANVTIRAKLVVCAEGFTAKAGDHLMIVGDICLGLYRPERPVIEAPQKRAPTGKLPPRRGPATKLLPPDTKILEAFRHEGPMTARQVRRLFNLPDNKQRDALTRRVRKLFEHGALIQHPDDQHARFPRYILPGAAEQAA